MVFGFSLALVTSVFAAFPGLLGDRPIILNSSDPLALDQSAVASVSESYDAKISDDGRFAVFVSYNSVSGAPDYYEQVYRINLETLQPPQIVSSIDGQATGASKTPANGPPAISANGRFVVFTSYASNLGVELSSNGVRYTQVFIKDMDQAGAPKLISQAPVLQADGSTKIEQIGTSGTYEPHVSADGRIVVFTSNAANHGAIGQTIFMKDLGPDPLNPNLIAPLIPVVTNAYNPEMSSDGRLLVYNQNSNIYLKDLSNLMSPPVLISTNKVGTSYCGYSRISSSGTHVSYSCGRQIYVKDIRPGVISDPVLISSNPASGEAGNGGSVLSNLSADGRYALFSSYATNLGIVSNGRLQVYRRDLSDMSAPLVLVSARNSNDPSTIGDYDSGLADQDGDGPSLSGDGMRAVFISTATNLVTGRTQGDWTVYAKGLSVPAPTPTPEPTPNPTATPKPRGKANAPGQIKK